MEEETEAQRNSIDFPPSLGWETAELNLGSQAPESQTQPRDTVLGPEITLAVVINATSCFPGLLFLLC